MLLNRFLDFGWDKVTIADMNQIYERHLEKFEIIRIQALELFDELEEWRLIQQHYFTAVAVKGEKKQQVRNYYFFMFMINSQ